MRLYPCRALTHLKCASLSSAAPLGRLVPPASLRADVRAQLLGRPRRSSGPPVEPAQLRDSLFQARLRRSSPAHHAHRRLGDALLPAARLPARLLLVVSCRRPQRAALPARHRAAVGESDTPRRAGGLVSGAASKAVVPLVISKNSQSHPQSHLT